MSENMTAPSKRTTIIVRDVEKSTAFYRDILGMDVFYEGLIGNPGASELMGMNISGLKMMVLNVDGAETGMVGLMELLDADPPLEGTEWSAVPKAGETILVIPTENMKALHERMVAEGYTVTTPPTKMEVPNRPEIHEMMARDPDGVIVNLTQRGSVR
jgi:catechol 2,3-dioxygenase-like lactoylglutathione lyase family enzyme